MAGEAGWKLYQTDIDITHTDMRFAHVFHVTASCCACDRLVFVMWWIQLRDCPFVYFVWVLIWHPLRQTGHVTIKQVLVTNMCITWCEESSQQVGHWSNTSRDSILSYELGRFTLQVEHHQPASISRMFPKYFQCQRTYTNSCVTWYEGYSQHVGHWGNTSRDSILSYELGRFTLQVEHSQPASISWMFPKYFQRQRT